MRKFKQFLDVPTRDAYLFNGRLTLIYNYMSEIWLILSGGSNSIIQNMSHCYFKERNRW